MANALPRAWEGEDIEVVGVVAGLPQLTEGGTRFPFDVESVQTPRVAAGVPLTVPPTVALTWFAERAKGGGEAIAPPRIVSGQRWHIVVRLKRPRGLANKQGYCYRCYHLNRNIVHWMLARACSLGWRIR